MHTTLGIRTLRIRTIGLTLAVLLTLLGLSAVSTPTAMAAGCDQAVASIGSVQGSGDVSPVAGTSATVRGTVVGDYEGPAPALRGFYVQDAGDDDSRTSDAIFVYDNGPNLVALGDVVEVTGAVSEFQGQTQLSATASGVRACGVTDAVTPIDLTLPRTSLGDLEPYEGMLVRFQQTLTVTETFQLGRFGQVVVSSGGRLRQPTADLRATDRDAVAAAQRANALNRLIIDDTSQAQNPDPIIFGRGGQPLSAQNTLRAGDLVSDPVGVLTYTWAGNAASGNAFRLRPQSTTRSSITFAAANARPSAPPAVGNGSLRVASVNLLNFFNTFSDCAFGVGGAFTDCRGAQNASEYQRQLAKEVASIRFLDADVIGYMELENDGYGPASAAQALITALNAADGDGSWAFVDPDAATGQTNAAGTDAIKAGLIYRADSVTPVGPAQVDASAIFERHPVAQTFRTRDAGIITVVANHFKSKGSCPTSGPDTDQGDGQSCWNARRVLQATELARWLDDSVVPAAGDPDVLITGDLNSYAGEDPIAVLADAGYVDLVRAYAEDAPYSYGFDGQWGTLDYLLASPSLRPQVSGAGDAHHNADEPTVLDYNTEFKTPGQVANLYAPDRFRTSDHDPALVAIDLAPTRVETTTTVTSSRNPSRFLRPVTFTATVTGTEGGRESGTEGGTVTFRAYGIRLGAPVPVIDGRAVSVPVRWLPPGRTTITARYSGSSEAEPSRGRVVQLVEWPR